MKRKYGRLAAARDIALVCLFLAGAAWAWTAFTSAPFFQKERLSRREALADLEYFFDKVEQTHPGRLAYLDEAGYAALKASSAREIEGRLDEFSRVPLRDFTLALSRAAAAFRDGHTRPHPRNRRDYYSKERVYPPFTLERRLGGFFAARAEDGGLEGARLLELDGRPAAAFLAPALERVPGENDDVKGAVFCADQAWWWEASALLADGAPLKARFRLPSGQVLARDHQPLAWRDFRRLKPSNIDPFRTIYRNKSLAWVNFTEMRYDRKARAAWDSLFKELREAGIRDLVIDIRRNGGGNSLAGEYVLAYLREGARGVKRREDAERFNGRAWLLTGPETFSSASIFAGRFRELGAGPVAGEATGQPPAHFGEVKTFKLPASGLRFGVSSKCIGGCAAAAAAPRFEPDLPFTEEALRKYEGSYRSLLLAHIEKQAAGEKKK
jgi:hypothetical protein